jgi:hypothetical protein
MSNTKLEVEFKPVEGWGAQIGWLDATVHEAIPGLSLNRFAVFRDVDTDIIGIGVPSVPGELPAFRHSAISFDTDRNRRRFVGKLLDALRAAHPELFEREPRS